MDSDPKTPDPEDRSVSKRKWKSGVEDWKRRIRDRVGGFGGSPEKIEAAEEGEEYDSDEADYDYI